MQAPIHLIHYLSQETSVAPPTESYLLDGYSINAAYSVRKLTNKNTPLMRVRRSTDNEELDVYSLSEVLPFCTTASGFVTTWYDQGPNDRHATQTVAAFQPQICESGSLYTLSAFNALQFNNNTYLSANIDIGAINTQYATLTTIYRYDNANRSHFGGATSAFKMRNSVTGTELIRNNVAVVLSKADTVPGLKVSMACYNGSLTRLTVNKLSEATTSTQIASNGVNVTRIGAAGSQVTVAEYLVSTMADCIFFNDSAAYPALHQAYLNLYGVV
jgi:hypothetical protein